VRTLVSEPSTPTTTAEAWKFLACRQPRRCAAAKSCRILSPPNSLSFSNTSAHSDSFSLFLFLSCTQAHQKSLTFPNALPCPFPPSPPSFSFAPPPCCLCIHARVLVTDWGGMWEMARMMQAEEQAAQQDSKNNSTDSRRDDDADGRPGRLGT
jgi:hypothetical protein